VLGEHGAVRRISSQEVDLSGVWRDELLSDNGSERIDQGVVRKSAGTEMSRIVLLLTVLGLALSACASVLSAESEKWTSDQVVEAFRGAGLPCEEVRAITDEDYRLEGVVCPVGLDLTTKLGPPPKEAMEGTRFFAPSLCNRCNGRIFSFASREDLEELRTWYVERGREFCVFESWLYVRDNILVQISRDMPEEKAQEYEAALKGMKKK
jgi:hypothetical protein